jgi:hypothetical protein
MMKTITLAIVDDRPEVFQVVGVHVTDYVSLLNDA